MSKILSVIGGPCAAKTTLCAELFSQAKRKGIHCEIIDESIKFRVYERGSLTFWDQYNHFSTQMFRESILSGKCDLLIEDCSPLLAAYYSWIYCERRIGNFKDSVSFGLFNLHRRALLNKIPDLEYIWVYLKHSSSIEYNQLGRIESLEEAVKIGGEVYDMIVSCKGEEDRLVIGESNSLDLNAVLFSTNAVN